MLPETEKVILAIMMDRNDVAPIVFENLDVSYFHDASMAIFGAIRDLRDDGMDLKWSTVRDYLGGRLVNPSGNP